MNEFRTVAGMKILKENKVLGENLPQLNSAQRQTHMN
jgi:hypothetical protein